MKFRARIFLLGSAFAFGLAIATSSSAQIATSTIEFEKGKSSAVVSGTITGDQTHDYVVRASAGQTMKVTLSGAPIVYFNVLAPGSSDEAIFIGSTEGETFSGTLGATGAYKLRVYQMRASGRRGESGAFRLSVSVTGDPGGTAPKTGAP